MFSLLKFILKKMLLTPCILLMWCKES